MSEFPKTFLRGLKGKTVITEEGYVQSEAFSFDTNKDRTKDNMLEMSINWEDCNEAVDLLLCQKKEDGVTEKFDVGFCRFLTEKLEEWFGLHKENKDFDYERYPLENNPYHGNLLLSPTVKTSIRRNITYTLANMATTDLYLRDSNQSPYLTDIDEIEPKLNNMPKISVIVPVYKAEQYLPQCIESILSQSYGDLELILVDDGSPDNSGAICDQYATKDNRVRVFHKENGGVSSARNLGIEEAQGEWITFVDADDAFAPNTLSICSDFFNESDIIRFSMKYVFSADGKQTEDYVFHIITREEYISRIISRETILGVCGGVYRTKLFKENNIRFDESLVNGEDWIVLAQLIFLTNSVKLLPDNLYLYNKINADSCTYSLNFKKAYSAILALNRMIELIRQYDVVGCENALAKAKCVLGYDFYASVILRSFDITNENIDQFHKSLALTKKEVSKGASNLKTWLLLQAINGHFGLGVLKTIFNRRK